jgi:hypothetical protein
VDIGEIIHLGLGGSIAVDCPTNGWGVGEMGSPRGHRKKGSVNVLLRPPLAIIA